MSQPPLHVQDARRPRDHRPVLAWIGILTGPAAWGLELFWSWAIGEWIACGRANSAPGRVFSFDARTFTGMVNGVLLALTILSGILSLVELRSVRSHGNGTPAGRAGWLAGAGVMTSILFSILIAVSYVPVALITGCRAT